MMKLLLFLIIFATISVAVEPKYMVLWNIKGSPADNDDQMYRRLKTYRGPHETVYVVTNGQGQVSSITNTHWSLDYVAGTNLAGTIYNVTCFSNGERDGGSGDVWYGWLREANGKSPVGQGALNSILQGQSPNRGGALTDTPEATINSNGIFFVSLPLLGLE